MTVATTIPARTKRDISPRSFAVNPSAFGRCAEIEWKEPASHLERDQLRAARLQHTYSYRAYNRLREQGMTIKAMAEREDTHSKETLYAVLRGETTMTFTYLAEFDRVLGGVIRPAVLQAVS